MADQSARPDVDIVIVGAGFAGLYMLHKARAIGLRARVFEAGSGVGGTWYWNRYPGARCDIESMEYSYGFDPDLQQEWAWSERYATQPEILRYAEHVADRFDLRRDITFDTRVLSAVFDAVSNTWRVTTDDGEQVGARFVVAATGCLSSTNTPEFAGIADYAGLLLHTGNWPHEPVDFTGRRVAVIGTGSSGIQSIPVIAEQAAHLTVFQRTPNYTVPAHNRPLDPDDVAAVKAEYETFREANRTMISAYGSRLPRNDVATLSVDEPTRVAQLEDRWRHGGLPFIGAFNDILLDRDANTVVADFVRGKIRDVVTDPETADLLTPSTVIGCKRLCVDTGYYATFNRDNVELIDINRSPIERFTPNGLIADGVAHEFDAVVLATGFDAMTGTLLKIDIRGRDGVTLQEAWAHGPRTYLGLQVVGLPEPVHDHRTGKPVGAHQHDRVDRAPRGVDRRCHLGGRRARPGRRSKRRPKPSSSGASSSTPSPTSRSSRRATPGISAPTFPASRASSCPTSDSRCTPTTSPRSPPTATAASSSDRPTCRRAARRTDRAGRYDDERCLCTSTAATRAMTCSSCAGR